MNAHNMSPRRSSRHWHNALLLSVLAASLSLSGCQIFRRPPPVSNNQPAPVAAKPVLPPNHAELQMEALRNLVNLQDRLDRVAAPLLLRNAELCKVQARNLLGFTAKNRYSYSSEYVEAASALYGLSEKLQVISVLPGSGAALAGVKRGDLLLRVEDKELPQGQNAERLAATILVPLVNGKSSIKMTLGRNGEQVQIAVPLTRACGFRVELGNADNFASYGDGQRVMITRGLLGFVQSDDELALLIAREMAHNALSHHSRHRSHLAQAAMIDNLIQANPDTSLLITGGGIKPYPADLDAAADYLSLYLAARAGYNTDAAPALWQRLATYYPKTVLSGHTALHPDLEARKKAVEKANGEIRSKLAAKKPLLPG